MALILGQISNHLTDIHCIECRIGNVMGSDGPSTLEFLHSTLAWLDQLEANPDPSLKVESVAELRKLLVARIARHELDHRNQT